MRVVGKADVVRRQGKAFGDILVDHYGESGSFWTLTASEVTVGAWMKGAPREACMAAAITIQERFDPSTFPGDPNDPAWAREKRAAPAAFEKACAGADA